MEQPESSLKHSKIPALKRLLVDDNINIDEAVVHVMRLKTINPDVHPRFNETLRVCLSQIVGYRQLQAEVESVRKVQYSSDNLDHEALLMQLWSTLKPDTQLKSRLSPQWTELGFQGDDPMTDFRGMGLLGLRNLLFFVSSYTDQARSMLTRSFHPQYGYSFAIVGINLTSLAYSMLTAGHLKTHFYNLVDGCPQLTHFHHVYCYLFVEFDKFWFDERPRDIMEFNRVKTKFQKQVIHKLKNKSTILINELIPC
ncbi:hypothetical protein NP493_1096g01016 [Ridgeia piscesae]|uniref:ELMO domain-containing protein n=1 Tax=Ridgeia piscesae TaxID=27915 RepID=A0AAD9KH76_RIDPI|nr:hypothetical protein NP493_1096g01016 [Ridgeia piscesae]